MCCSRLGNAVMQPSGLERRIPVFVFPQSLTFYVGDSNTHKQILTLYNPYDFRINFNVLCNNPLCFDIEPPNGVVYSKCSVDIIVTRTNLSLNEARERDTIRIAISEEGVNQIIGKKDILATLQTGVPNPQSGSDTDHFESVRGHSPAGAGALRYPQGIIGPQQQPFGPGTVYNGPSLLLVGAAVLCLLGLLLPTEGEDASARLPPYLHLSTNIKIVISYVLGLLTYAILRPA
ncbi:motile sperm domain-containing protein 1-like isoform X2 [Eriocheir sinensis]|uniref:motile sperm domain-containing protein 1-like isoform X2 n=2 Tax=Eriocheir sinensis TaxID=95602 RepID=UPI0021C89515|nr:motile sperm domain-containing protein 1-like isoform X2 [Eriocheir sinensis]